MDGSSIPFRTLGVIFLQIGNLPADARPFLFSKPFPLIAVRNWCYFEKLNFSFLMYLKKEIFLWKNLNFQELMTFNYFQLKIMSLQNWNQIFSDYHIQDLQFT